MMKQTIKERPVLQGRGFVLLRNGQQAAIAHECIGAEAWSVRIAGARFPLSVGQRFLTGRNRRYGELTYVASEIEARDLATRCLRRQRKPHVIDVIYQTGVR